MHFSKPTSWQAPVDCFDSFLVSISTITILDSMLQSPGRPLQPISPFSQQLHQLKNLPSAFVCFVPLLAS